ncbi:hypothetical protein TrispH2_009077 [Trichoplax sp. H2]|uniref:MADF domain-containing protein n=1 Tax=Trichoplax adhaerens TaxID=10228 RepID=B3RJR1_TRIAD|nr:hypothetical protein TRIADDRAFT_51555 [Trichoplax adhaerens]EDV29336.1 hypothetical protein TRIADDRAFT_51555 [Trichoplax adhaerens]RDD38882.1 hypothetical protein TrispH2_009077 [Trichoplax sp. H2]|eukprot:XP_002108538.1 hypothetical protein TRIADDRAFT_51555 [Trichoplax adhaerens]
MAEVDLNTCVAWTPDLTLKLIHDFREQPHLWDLKHPSYTDRENRKHTWADIGTKLNISQSEIERKCHTLRLKFYRERRKLLLADQYGIEDGNPSTSDWQYYKELEFLTEFCQSVKTETEKGVKKDLEDCSLNIPVQSCSINTLKSMEESNNSFSEGPENNHSIACNDNSIGIVNGLEKPCGVTMKRKRLSLPTTNVDDQQEACQSFPNVKDANIQYYLPKVIQMDHIDSFGQYVAAEMHTFKNKRLLQVVKDKIYDILRKARCDKETLLME